MRIFVSSTFSDLQAHRDAVRTAIQSLDDSEFVGAEYLSASGQPPVAASKQQIYGSFAFILILGWRYGYVPEGETKSVVELEYDAALSDGTAILCYAIDQNYPVPPKYIESGDGAERLRKLKDRIRRERVVKTFTTPEDLARQVAIDVTHASKRSLAKATEDIVARTHLENELGESKETVATYEATIDALRERLSSLVPAAPIWARRNFRIDDSLCFSVMPFQDAFFCVHEDAVLPAARAAGLRALHAGEIFDNREVIEDVWESICTARIIVADVTGRNPNVFYELGICHTLGKEVIVITQNPNDVPFDIRHRRFLEYKPDTLTSLKMRLEKTIKNILVRTDSGP